MLAQSSSACAIVVHVDALPALESVPPRTVLVARNDQDLQLADKLDASATTITVPDDTLDRFAESGQLETVVRREDRPRSARPPVHPDGPGPDDLRELPARVPREVLCEETIEPLPRCVRGDASGPGAVVGGRHGG